MLTGRGGDVLVLANGSEARGTVFIDITNVLVLCDLTWLMNKKECRLQMVCWSGPDCVFSYLRTMLFLAYLDLRSDDASFEC